MRKLRVLVIGSSLIARQRIEAAIQADLELELAGVAAGARLGLVKIAQEKPDLVVLGTELPRGDHAELLATIHRDFPFLCVIPFPHGGTQGTPDSPPEPWISNPQGLEEAIHRTPDGLLATIKQRRRSAETHQKSDPRPESFPATPRVEVLAIGASTGGPEALSKILSSIPLEAHVPVLVVQHLPANFTRFFAERLACRTGFIVHEVVSNTRLVPGQIWLAAGNHHMVVVRDAQGVFVECNEDPPVQSCRPSVDVLFRSVAAAYGRSTLAVVLTGMGCDGLAGCMAIRAAGGQVLVQDEATSVIWGMPGHVARADLANRVLPLDELGPEISLRLRNRTLKT